jgi:Putative beta-barrel porin-2, OmpL-like. bbp2
LKKILLPFLLLQTTLSLAQNDTTKKPLTFSGYGELYYSYDFAKPSNHEKPNFLYNHKRHNEINFNLIYVKAKYNKNNVRANLALMAGNYAQYNLSAEPSWAQFINEANIGVKLSSKHNVWLDAGIMPSHIGFESAISADCYTLTRSMAAENSPYFETGAKLTYTNKKENITTALLVLNGWQKIQKPNYIQQTSFGVQLNYKPNKNITLNYSNFIGTDKPDSLKALRTYHNFYVQYEPENKLALIAGVDVGTDKYNLSDYGTWFSPVAIVRYSINNKTKIALRGEYFFDKNQIIIATNTLNGFQTTGLSANLDYKISNEASWRIEGKMYNSKDKIFENGSRNNFCVSSNLVMRF